MKEEVYMKIIDISQELFACDVFPGDSKPERKVLETIKDGSICNLTGLSMCAHNGTHVDAPYHFYDDGKTIDEIDLNAFIGKCFVTFENGPLNADKAKEIMSKAKNIDLEAAKRILIGGDMFVTLDAASVFADEGILLIGNESQTVGPLNAPAAVHYELLKKEVVLLEGIRLNNVKEGVYFLNCVPLNLGRSDGAPCRAILIDNDIDRINRLLETVNKTNQDKIDWTKAWSEKYPVLKQYQSEVNIPFYASAISEMLKKLQDEYGYSKQDAMLALKDILYQEYKH